MFPFTFFFEPDLPTVLTLALIIGFFFGWILERAGFGRADILTGVFYFHNFRVIQVMFTALLTAMPLVAFGCWMDWLEARALAAHPVFWLSQGLGGLLLGAGMAAGGYCPGTAMVATASGKTDGLAFFGGLCGGSLLFTVGYSWLQPLHDATPAGRLTLPKLLNGSPGLTITLTVLAGAGFLYWLKGKEITSPAGWR